MSKTDNQPVSISDQRQQLNQLLAWFESEDFTVEEAIDKFSQAEALAAEIEKSLREYKNRITVLKTRFDEAG